jgi:HAD superfamily hydrolase (TIGR01549 family)
MAHSRTGKARLLAQTGVSARRAPLSGKNFEFDTLAKSPGRTKVPRRVNGTTFKSAPVPKSIIFDVEGTLIDCADHIIQSWNQTLARFGYDFSIAELHRYSDMDPDDMLRILLPDAGGDQKNDIKSEQSRHYRATFLPEVKAFAGARALLSSLRRSGRRIALATTCQSEELATYLDLAGVPDLIDVVACGDDKARGKPHPDLFRLALGRLGERKNAVALGDTPYDAIAAGRAGIRAIGTTTGGFLSAELQDAGCQTVIRRLSELCEYV